MEASYRKKSRFSTAPVVVNDNKPLLASADLSRSYQWPFHLRVHPDCWEYVDGKWRLEIERVHLRPGVAGVGVARGQHERYEGVNDVALLRQWSEYGDGKWVIISNGDKRIDANGFEFMEDANVAVVENGKRRDGTIIMASWETINTVGRIVIDNDLLAEASSAIAKALWGMDGPSQRAKDVVAQKLRGVLSHLIGVAQSRPVMAPNLVQRIERLRDKLNAVTGGNEFSGFGVSRQPAAPALDPQTSMLQQLLAMPAAERAELLAVLSMSASAPVKADGAPNV